MTLETPIREVEDFSIGTVELLEKHGLVTLGDVLRWTPTADAHPFAVDNIQSIFEDLGHEWPAS